MLRKNFFVSPGPAINFARLGCARAFDLCHARATFHLSASWASCRVGIVRDTAESCSLCRARIKHSPKAETHKIVSKMKYINVAAQACSVHFVAVAWRRKWGGLFPKAICQSPGIMDALSTKLCISQPNMDVNHFFNFFFLDCVLDNCVEYDFPVFFDFQIHFELYIYIYERPGLFYKHVRFMKNVDFLRRCDFGIIISMFQKFARWKLIRSGNELFARIPAYGI